MVGAGGGTTGGNASEQCGDGGARPLEGVERAPRVGQCNSNKVAG